MLFDVGRASGTKLCRLLWNTNLVEIELSSLCLPWSYIEFLYFSVKRQHWYRGVPCRDSLFFRAPEAVTTAKRQMSWKENSSLLRLWPYQGMKHTVSQNGEFIARYC